MKLCNTDSSQLYAKKKKTLMKFPILNSIKVLNIYFLLLPTLNQTKFLHVTDSHCLLRYIYIYWYLVWYIYIYWYQYIYIYLCCVVTCNAALRVLDFHLISNLNGIWFYLEVSFFINKQQTEFHLVYNQKENCQYNHIYFSYSFFYKSSVRFSPTFFPFFFLVFSFLEKTFSHFLVSWEYFFSFSPFFSLSLP